jgi:hypothetical protein
MNVHRHVTPLIVILLLTVLFVGVVTIHPPIGTGGPVLLEGAALKYKGVAYLSYAPNEYASAGSNLSLNALKNTGANYVSVLVTQYLSNSTSNAIFPDPNRTPTDASVIDAINDIHARGMGVLLKPQLLCEDGQGQGDLAPTNPTAWFASYATFINHYAQIAQNNGVELFCVGCELNHLDTSNYDANWRTVISGVRAIYKGPLTYAADWSTYARISFWGALDYAGIDAYFPLSNAQTPSVANCVAGWSSYNGHNWLQEIETFQATVNKPVLFTEIGYRSYDYAAMSPWDWTNNHPYNANGQANCYEAAWQVFANKPWFAGMFWWGWTPDSKAGGAGDTNYTPQNKPAQSVLTADWLRTPY